MARMFARRVAGQASPQAGELRPADGLDRASGPPAAARADLDPDQRELRTEADQVELAGRTPIATGQDAPAGPTEDCRDGRLGLEAEAVPGITHETSSLGGGEEWSRASSRRQHPWPGERRHRSGPDAILRVEMEARLLVEELVVERLELLFLEERHSVELEAQRQLGPGQEHPDRRERAAVPGARAGVHQRLVMTTRPVALVHREAVRGIAAVEFRADPIAGDLGDDAGGGDRGADRVAVDDRPLRQVNVRQA